MHRFMLSTELTHESATNISTQNCIMEAGGWGGVGVNDYLALYMHAVRTSVYRCGRGLVGVMDMSKAAGAGY